MKIWQKVLVGFGLLVALAVPTGIAVAATGGGDHGHGGWHDGSEMMDGRGGDGSMDMVRHHDGSMDHGSMDHGSMDHGSMDHGPMDHGDMGGPMDGGAPAR